MFGVSPAQNVSPLIGSTLDAVGVYNASSPNWEGYVITGAAGSVQVVQGSWYVPNVNCSQTPSSVSASWVGIDGWTSSTVEQIGTISDCNGLAAVYFPWYEFWPQSLMELVPYSIGPGDVINATVSTAFGIYRLSECDITQNWCYTTLGTVYGGAADDSAEWITEAYFLCSATCQEQPLADFGHTYYGSSFTGMVSTDNALIGRSSGPIGSFADVTGDTVYNVGMYGCPSGCPALTSGLFLNGTSFYTSWTSAPTPRNIGITVSPNSFSVAAGSTITFTATATDTAAGIPSSPVGTVSWSASAEGGSFRSSTCLLTAINSTSSSCATTYTAAATPGTVEVIASYPGDSVHSADSATSSFTTVPVLLSCSPSSVVVGASTTCRARVYGTSPTGLVTWSSSGSGKFSALTCKLSKGSCKVKYIPTSGSSLVTITANYLGDTKNPASSATFSLTVTQATSKTIVVCSPTSVKVGKTIKCTAVVTGYGPTGTVTWSWTSSNGGSVTFSTSATCTLVKGRCSVEMTGTTAGTVVIQATYNGDLNNAASSKTRDLTIT